MKLPIALLLPLLLAAAEEKVQLTITGGHDTDPRDRGRPVILVASGLGVPAEVFREAFSHVTPAPGGREPDPAQVQRNKAALLDALGRYGVTNELLDRVSDSYRYPPGGNRLWRTTAASAYAVVKDGKVTSIVITQPGSGYSSPPTISAPGHPDVRLKPTLAFGKDLAKNGSVESIAIDR